MSNELATSFPGTATLYVVTRRLSDGTVRDHVAGAWDTWADGDIADYDLPLVDLGGDLYAVDAHAGLVSGIIYRFTYYKQAGGTPAITDLVLASDEGTWNGSTVTPTPTPTTTTSGTVYCSVADVESILAQHGVTAFVDDDFDGSRSAAEAQLVADAISRAAALDLNPSLDMRYTLSDLSSNAWCRWANAICAAVQVAIRRGNPNPQALLQQCEKVADVLEGVRQGWMKLPDQAESFDHRALVTNYKIQRWAGSTPARVVASESTGPEQPSILLRRKTDRERRLLW